MPANGERACGHKGWLQCQERFAASTGMTGSCRVETVSSFFGEGRVPKSAIRPTFLTTYPCKAEQFTLNSRPRYDSMLASGPDKAHNMLVGLRVAMKRPTNTVFVLVLIELESHRVTELQTQLVEWKRIK